MANIMLTDACNLKCPYCFANEFVNKDKNDITKEAFDEATDFIVGDGTHTLVGLIGGEPTIHPRFEHFSNKLISDRRVKRIVVFTNGICLDRYMDIITHEKVYLLINCNPPSDTGEADYNKLVDNIGILFRQNEVKDRTYLGINMYKADFEYLYFTDLLVRYDHRNVRASIAVPNI